MKDFLGKDIAVGDTVIFNPPRYKGLIKGRVVKFTPKMIKIAYVGSGFYRGSNEVAEYSNQVVVVSQEVK